MTASPAFRVFPAKRSGGESGGRPRRVGRRPQAQFEKDIRLQWAFPPVASGPSLRGAELNAENVSCAVERSVAVPHLCHDVRPFQRLLVKGDWEVLVHITSNRSYEWKSS